MSKVNLRILGLLLSALLVLTGTACSNSNKEEGDLSVMVYAAGYGFTWVEEMISVYNEAHPEVEVVAGGDSLAFDTIKTQLDNGTCKYDIVVIDSSYYEQYVSNGLLEKLDDMYEMTIVGSDKKVKDVVAKQILNARTIDGSIYGVPWQQGTGSGLVYNKKLFEQYGWDDKMPETMDQLYELYERIDGDTKGRVSPFVYGGADGRGYMGWNFSQWLCEYYGYDAMMEYLKLESPVSYTAQKAGRTKVYETIAELTMGKTSSGRNFALSGSSGATAITAATNFVNGKAAMISYGQWFPTEMKSYMELTQFECGYIPMPHINADRKNGDGTIDTSDVRFSTDGNMMAIPSTSKNKELAKDFLAYMFTEKSYTSFVKSNNGLLRPVEGLTADSSTFNEFTKSAYDYFCLDGKAKTVYQVSQNGILEKGTLAMFVAHKGGYFSEITSQATYDAAMKIAGGCFASELDYVNQRWDSTSNRWK